tara:strand:- start:116 stop:343 length:228 start_codon:yes stop_codon:yes gene_type:complete
MFQKIDLNKLLFSEIEAVPKKSTFNEISKTEKELFPYKIKHQHSEDQSPRSFDKKLGKSPEFRKIVLKATEIIFL